MRKERIQAGIISGLVAIVPVAAMQVEIRGVSSNWLMVGSPFALAWLLSLFASGALSGGAFSVLFDRFIPSTACALGFSLLYAFAWWGVDLVGPFFSSIEIVHGPNWGPGAATRIAASLMQVLVYGIFLGLSYWWVRERLIKRRHHRIVARRLVEIRA